MSTERRMRLGREGFTLFEVLAAMIILAVGLLALEALGIGAARAVIRADEQSEYTALATDRLEQTLVQVRQGLNPADSRTPVDGAVVDIDVARTAIAGGTTFSYVVTVVVTPPSNTRINLDPITVVGRAIR